MDLQQRIATTAKNIFATRWHPHDVTFMPLEGSISLGDHAFTLDGAVLYATLANATHVVETCTLTAATEIFNAFLFAASGVIASGKGQILSADATHVKAVFTGPTMRSDAVRAAWKLRWAIGKLLQPAFEAQYPTSPFAYKLVVGIDTSALFVAKTRLAGVTRLIWTGRATEYAARLALLPDTHSTYISAWVHDGMAEDLKGGSTWENVRWNTFDDQTIYRSLYWLPLE